MIRYLTSILVLGAILQVRAGHAPPSEKPTTYSEVTDSLTPHANRDVRFEQPSTQFDFPAIDELIKTSILEPVEDNLEDVQAKAVEYDGNPKVKAARAALAALDPSRMIDFLTSEELFKLPVGISSTINGYTYSIVFQKAKLHANYAELTVYGSIQKPNETDLLFGADDIKFSYEGGIIGDASLALFADYPIKRESKKLAFLFKAYQNSGGGNESGCYIKFDCNGFVSLRVDGDIIISRDWVLPTDAFGKVSTDLNRVQANLAVTLSDMNDFVVEASIPYFTLARDTSIAFLVDHATIDFSDSKSAFGFTPPPDYDVEADSIHQFPMDTMMQDLWKGIYFDRIEVILPKVFKQDNAALSIGAEQIYIDSRGVTGIFYAQDVLPLSKGKIGQTGWAFAVDKIDIAVIYSQVYGFGFDGRIAIPIGGESEAVAFEASADLATETYNFNVGVDSTMVIPMWDVTKVNFNRGSKINVGVVRGDFKVQAVLCGNMKLSMKPREDNKNTALDIADIVFEQLIIQDTLPYVSLGSNNGHISFISRPKLNNSLLNIDHASISTYQVDKAMFTLGMEAGVMSSEDGGGKTAGAFGIVGKPIMSGGQQSWAFDEMKLMALEVHLDFADAGYIKGGIEFFANDPIYGNGFMGYLEGGFVKDGSRYQFAAAASARFGTMSEGSTEEYKYWSFDVYISSSTVAIPIYPPIAANGFGGGMYHHMSMAGYDLGAMAENGLNNPYSGIVYEPDNKTRLGLKATIGLTTTSGKAFQGVVTLELSFNQNLSLREIKLYGTGEIAGSDTEGWAAKQKDGVASNVLERTEAAAINEQEAAGKANTITCAVMLRVSLVDGFTMHGAFNAYIDAGQGKITGKGTLDLYASTVTNEWHLYIGGYANNSITNVEGEVIPPVSVGINFEAFSVTASLYLMMGTDLPGPPPLSPQLAAFFGSSSNSVNRSRLTEGGRSPGNGTGAAFGSSVELSFKYYNERNNGTINKNKYIDVNGGAGFDLALLSFSDLSKCSEASNFPHGQKGWRAYGRLFLYAQISGKWWLTIPTQHIGFIAEGDLPNPDYFNVQLKVNIAKVININKNVELGSQCGTVAY